MKTALFRIETPDFCFSPPRHSSFAIRHLRLLPLAVLLVSLATGLHAADLWVTNTDNDGPGSLRQAITDANASPSGPNTIKFNIPGPGPHTIAVDPELPAITNAAIIDGFSQPGSLTNTTVSTDNAVRQIRLRLSDRADTGLLILADHCVVRGLDIAGFKVGIGIQGHAFAEIVGNALHGNGRCGIVIEDSSYNRVGGTNVAERNLVYHNGKSPEIAGIAGIWIWGAGARYNWVRGNFIGLDAAGLPEENKDYGVKIENAGFNFIGDDTAGAGNVIAANNSADVYVGTNSSFVGSRAISEQNRVLGNFIGTDPSGAVARGSAAVGVLIVGGRSNWVGGAVVPGMSNPRNIISGHAQSGVRIERHSAGATADGNMVQGNFIGTDATGLVRLGNGGDGVYVSSGCSSNTIGGEASMLRPEGNVISGNAGSGVALHGPGNTVQGNFIGTDPTGSFALPNTNHGVEINTPDNVIGGDNASSGNVISGNLGHGVLISGSAATGNIVQGNDIGTGRSAAPLGNGLAGVSLVNAPANRIGGPTISVFNVISGNAGHGVEILNGSGGTTVQGNRIGVNLNSTAAIPNGGAGVYVAAGADGNTIGGVGRGNTVGGNYSGIDIHSSRNLVQGNFIGTDATGRARLGNCGSGVLLFDAASGNCIGGTATGQGNLITDGGGRFCGPDFPPACGVEVAGPGSTNNAILGNAIWENRDLGIDLVPHGVTTNDFHDLDSGPNNRQNCPELTAATNGSSVLHVEWRLHSAPLTTFRFDFYANTDCDPSGYGEGQRHIAHDFGTTDNGGNLTKSADFPASVPRTFRFLTATATDPDSNTSEFSACVPLAFVNHKPVAVCSNITAQTLTNCTADATIDAGSFDPDGSGDPITLSLTPPPPYGLGTTLVTLCVTDSWGAFDCCSATVTVFDTLPPTITSPDIVQPPDAGTCQAIVFFAPTATDNCPGPISVVCTPSSGSKFPIGSTKVACTATDAAGNKTTRTFSVTITSTAACPELKVKSAAASPSGLLSLVVETPYPAAAHYLEVAHDPAAQQWGIVPNVQFTPPNGNFIQALFMPDGSPRFYRIRTSIPGQ